MRRIGAVLTVVFVWFLVKWTPGGLTSINEFGDFIGGPKPEGFQGWGTEEVRPPAQGGNFVRVHVPDMSMEEAKGYTGIHFNTDGTPAKRRGQLDIEKLPPVTVDQMERDGQIEFSSSLFKATSTLK